MISARVHRWLAVNKETGHADELDRLFDAMDWEERFWVVWTCFMAEQCKGETLDSRVKSLTPAPVSQNSIEPRRFKEPDREWFGERGPAGRFTPARLMFLALVFLSPLVWGQLY